ncbi:hypothetical protein DFP72DRAFT_916275 [Ephemerocybe angulata]|uniref:Uncharacterized protein n=1 Tax=Ephemerocybe angulata TaxID=980116 RepID=A0A8H6HKU3_9AGAR|nr:hypothetical protein DFP72DRAFT_916275 [Tulosesus angulatus]
MPVTFEKVSKAEWKTCRETFRSKITELMRKDLSAVAKQWGGNGLSIKEQVQASIYSAHPWMAAAAGHYKLNKLAGLILGDHYERTLKKIQSESSNGADVPVKIKVEKRTQSLKREGSDEVMPPPSKKAKGSGKGKEKATPLTEDDLVLDLIVVEETGSDAESGSKDTGGMFDDDFSANSWVQEASVTTPGKVNFLTAVCPSATPSNTHHTPLIAASSPIGNLFQAATAPPATEHGTTPHTPAPAQAAGPSLASSSSTGSAEGSMQGWVSLTTSSPFVKKAAHAQPWNVNKLAAWAQVGGKPPRTNSFGDTVPGLSDVTRFTNTDGSSTPSFKSYNSLSATVRNAAENSKPPAPTPAIDDSVIDPNLRKISFAPASSAMPSISNGFSAPPELPAFPKKAEVTRGKENRPTDTTTKPRARFGEGKFAIGNYKGKQSAKAFFALDWYAVKSNKGRSTGDFNRDWEDLPQDQKMIYKGREPAELAKAAAAATATGTGA